MMYSFTLGKLLLALLFLALDAVADDDSSLIDAQAQGNNQIISSGDWTLDDGSTTNEPRLLQQQQQQQQQGSEDLPPPPADDVLLNNESLLLSDDDESDCAPDLLQSRRAALAAPPPGAKKLRRLLRFAKRGEQQQLSCPAVQEEIRKPGAGAGAGARLEPIPPPSAPGGSTSTSQQVNPNRKKRPTTMRKVINEGNLRPTTDISVCGFQRGLEIPICAPYFVTVPDASVLLLRPCRFWRLEDECEDLIEDLWCCKSAYVDQSPGWRLNVMTQRYFSTAEVCRRVRDAQIRN